MGKPVDFEAIREWEKTADLYPPDIAELRFSGSIKRGMGMRPTQEELAALALGTKQKAAR